MQYNINIPIWRRSSNGSNYTFTKKPERDDLGFQFLLYIEWRLDEGGNPSRKEFLRYMKRPTYSGYLTSFFGSIKAAGIVQVTGRNKDGWIYDLGPNAEAYRQGKMSCIVWDWENRQYKVILGQHYRENGIR